MITETTDPAVVPALQPAPPTRLWNKNYLLLWQGQFVSRIGNQLFEIALVLWVVQLTNSATLMGFLLMLSSIPALILVPIGGIFADRYSRRRTILLCDFIAGITLLALAAVPFLAPGQVTLHIAAVFVAAVMLSFISSFFGPAISAAIPDLVPKERLSSAYAMGQFSQEIAVFIGQGLGGTLFRILGGPLLFLINGLTFLFSAFSQIFIHIPQPPRIIERNNGWRAHLHDFWNDLLGGFTFIKEQHGLRAMVIATAITNFFTAPMLLLMPFYVQEHLQTSVDWYGYLLAATGIGSIIGYIFVSLRPVAGRARMIALLGAMLLENGLYGVLVLTYNPFVALGIMLLSGMFSAFAIVHITTLVQLRTPAELRGRISALLATLAGVVTPIAFGISGIVADLTRHNMPLIYLTCSAILVLVIFTLTVNQPVRHFLAYDPPPEQLPPAGPLT